MPAMPPLERREWFGVGVRVDLRPVDVDVDDADMVVEAGDAVAPAARPAAEARAASVELLTVPLPATPLQAFTYESPPTGMNETLEHYSTTD
jgi:hypothetical protein